MPSPSPQDLKKLLIGAGLEIYRTLGDRVVLADRVRDNLIMDSGVSVVATGSALVVRFVARAQASDFQGESSDSLFGHARRIAQHTTGLGYAEVSTAVVPIHDPGDRTRILDTWYEVAFERVVADEAEMIGELRNALGWAKVATRTGP
jgi:hypothetical protein